MLYSIDIRLKDGTELSSLGGFVKQVMIYSSMDSLFPQLEFTCVANDIDLLGRGVLKFGTELEIAVLDENEKQITKFYFCVYNIKLIDQFTKHSTVGTLRVACVGRWYFRQMAASAVYKGTPADALISVLREEAGLDYTDILVQGSFVKMINLWYRCSMTASKFIKTILEPNYLIDESPSYVFANDIGQITSDSYLTILRRAGSALLIDPIILSVISGVGDITVRPIGINDFEIDMGDESAWQNQAQRLVFLSENYSVVSGGVEPMSYLTPLGIFPPKLYQMDSNYYVDPLLSTQVVMDDSGNTSANVRARFINTHRKKGIEAFKINVSMENDYRLTVGSVVELRLTSLPQGNPGELKQRLSAEQLKFPESMDNSVLSGKYFIKKLRRSFIQNINGAYSCIMEPTIVKCQ